jgi:hypothetical protein
MDWSLAMIDMSISEDEMRRSLGLDTSPAPAAKPLKNKPSAATPCRVYTEVQLSVRKDGGTPTRFTYQSRSVSKLLAQLEAEKEARRQGFEVWALLYVNQIAD